MNSPRTNKYFWFAAFGLLVGLIFIALSMLTPSEEVDEIGRNVEKYAVIAVLVRVLVVSCLIYLFYNNILAAAERYTGVKGFMSQYVDTKNRILIWYIAIEAVLLLSFI